VPLPIAINLRIDGDDQRLATGVTRPLDQGLLHLGRSEDVQLPPVTQPRHARDPGDWIVGHRALRKRNAEFSCGLGEPQIGVRPEQFVEAGWRDDDGDRHLSAEKDGRDIAMRHID